MMRDDQIFADAIDLPAHERVAFAERACLGDAALQTRVGALLENYERAQAYFGQPLVATAPEFPDEKPGDKIARYTLLERIGEGGCGVVWHAAQREPVRRAVALKVIKLGMDTREVIARFEAERQALAVMDHPAIARVFDGGATATGRPFFVMEFVRGLPITRHCDAHALGLAERIGLFLQVCDAVQHAHQKGIIHRDLKPSNILVASEMDRLAPGPVQEPRSTSSASWPPKPAAWGQAAPPSSRPCPKVIDFGIAKATQGRLTDATLQTGVHQIMGTPAYMSPEQATSGGGDIDTRVDVYSLGVVLYELLTGDTPLGPSAHGSSGYEEVREKIRTIEPSRPSTRLRVTAAANAPRSFGFAELQGDLDWIVMRCLEKDRARRYESVEALALDLRRYLAHEPVTARPPSPAYLIGRMVRRHRGAFAAGGAVIAVLAAGAIASTWQAVRATRAEREQSELRTAAETAQGTEAALRAEAERQRMAEAHRWSRFDFANATRLIEQGRMREGVAFLVHAAQLNPENRAVAVRLLTTLASRSFVRPLEPITVLPAPRLGEQRVGRHGNFTRDGRSFGILCADGVYRLVNVESGRIEREFPVGRAATGAEIIGPWLRVLTDRRRGEFWEISTGQRAGEWPAPDDVPIESGASAPDGRWVARVEGPAIRVWDIAARREVLTLRAGDRPRGLNFSPDGTRLVAIARDGSWVKVWEMPGGELRTDIAIPTTGGGAINPGLSYDNRTVAVLLRDGVQLFDAATSAPRGPLLRQPGHRSGNDDPVFTPDNRFVIMAGTDRTVQVWRVDTGEPAYPPFVHGGGVDEVRVVASGRLLVVPSADGITHLWDLRTGRAAIEPFKPAMGSRESVSPDGQTIVEMTQKGDVRRHRTDDTAMRSISLAAWPEARAAAWRPDRPATWQRIGRQTVRQIDLAADGREREVAKLPAAIARVWPAPNGSVWLVRTESGTWQAWWFAGDRIEPVTLGGFPSAVPEGALMPSADGTRVIVRGVPDERALQVWNLRTGKPAGPPVRANDRIAMSVRGTDLSPDKRFVATIAGGEGWTWEVETGKLLYRLQPLQRQLRCLEFTPDGQLLMVEFLHGARLWNAVTGQPRTEHLPHRGGGAGLFSGGISPQGDRMMTFSGSTGTALVRAIATGDPSGPQIEHGHELMLVPVWSPGGTRLATVGTDGTARVWEIATGAVLAALPYRVAGLPNPRGVGMLDPARTHQMSFSPDGRFLAITMRGQPTQVWAAPPRSEAPVPRWLLELATLIIGGTVDDDGKVIDAPVDSARWEALRREIESLPANAPYAEWGKWLVSDPERRGWAPGVARVEGGDVLKTVSRPTND